MLRNKSKYLITVQFIFQAKKTTTTKSSHEYILISGSFCLPLHIGNYGDKEVPQNKTGLVVQSSVENEIHCFMVVYHGLSKVFH